MKENDLEEVQIALGRMTAMSASLFMKVQWLTQTCVPSMEEVARLEENFQAHLASEAGQERMVAIIRNVFTGLSSFETLLSSPPSPPTFDA